MRSLKQQARIIETAANKSRLTETFLFDERWERPTVDNTVYPLVNVWTDDFSIIDGMLTQPFEMLVVDYSETDGTTRLQNLSDCQLLLLDILTIIKQEVDELGAPVIKIDKIGTARKVIDGESNHATGWLVTFSLVQKYDRDYCEVPKN